MIAYRTASRTSQWLALFIFSSAILIGCTSDSRSESEKVDPTAFKQAVTEHITAGNYQAAIQYVKACDMIHLATLDYQNKGDAFQFFCVMEDGTDLPGLDTLAISIKDLIDLSQSAWCFPGTSDAQNPGDETNWQKTAHQAARQYNTHLYQLRAPTRVK